MILILSNNDDRTTNKVCGWLLKEKKLFKRVHEDEIFCVKKIEKK